MNEAVRRLAPQPDALRSLYLKSGNLCAFPGCNHLMMDPAGNFIGQVCHIEAAMPGGERFNALMSNEDRRSETNLMLMCYAHHVATNDTAVYSSYALKEMKRLHEQRFSDPSQIMFRSLTDSTLEKLPELPNNLGRLFRIIGWTMSSVEVGEMLEEAAENIKKFSRVPLEIRHFLGQFAARLDYMKSVRQAPRDGTRYFLPVSDVEGAFQIDSQRTISIFSQMSTYRLGGIEEVPVEGIYPPHGAFLYPFNDDWDFWLDVAKFCRKSHIDITAICDNLQFRLLDD